MRHGPGLAALSDFEKPIINLFIFIIFRDFFIQIVSIAARTGTVPRQNRYSAGDPVHAAIANITRYYDVVFN